MKKNILFISFLVLGFIGISQTFIQMPLIQPTTDFKPIQQSLQTQSSRAVNDTIWSNDFSTPTDWTMYHTGGSGDWEIQNTFNQMAGCTTGSVLSTSLQNGYAIFDACQYGDTLGENAFIEYNGTIDCSAYSNVSIRFQQILKKGTNTQTFVEVSTNGSTWDTYEVNNGIAPEGIATNSIVLNISNTAANQSNIYIRFFYHGEETYVWSIDDIALVEGGDYDLVALSFQPQFIQNGIPAGWFCELPYSNILPLGYRTAAVKNAGVNYLTGLMLSTQITENGNTVFSHISDSTVMASDTLFPAEIDTLIDTTTFYPATTPNHTYTVEMVASMNETDQDTSTNILSPPKTFSITDGVMRRSCLHNCWLSPSNYGYNNGSYISDIIFLPNTDTIFWMDFTVLADSIALANGASLQGEVYLLDSTSGDWLSVISTDIYDITPSDTVIGGHQVNLPFLLDGFTEILQNSFVYAVGVKFYYTNGWVGIAANNSSPQNFQNMNAIYFNNAWYYTNCTPDIGLHFNPFPQFDTLPQTVVDTCIYFNYNSVYVDGYVWIDPTHVEVTWAFSGSGQFEYITAVYEVPSPGNYVLSIAINCGTKSLKVFYDNLYIDQYVRVDKENKIIEKYLLIYPNPAKDFVHICFKPEGKIVNIEIFDAIGQSVYQKQTTKTDNLILSVSNLQSGTYFIRVKTGKTIYLGQFSK